MSPIQPDALDVFLAHLDQRRSLPAKQLGLPGPNEPTLMRMLASAVRVPDHGKRVPFRFIRISGDSGHALGDALVARTRELNPDAGDTALDKDRKRFTHAPLVIVVVARLGEDTKIPVQERLLTTGCVCFALLQAAQAAGFGAQWLTGWPAYDTHVHTLLGMNADEAVAGFIHIGTASIEAPERDRPDAAELLSDWTPA